jgi:hypothetical protein
VQGGWSRAVVAKQLAEKVQRGQDVTKAVLETLDEQKAVPVQSCPSGMCRTSQSGGDGPG